MKAIYSFLFFCLALLGFSAHAAIDVTNVTTEIGGIAAPAAAIGGAMLVAIVGIKVWKMIRRAM